MSGGSFIVPRETPSSSACTMPSFFDEARSGEMAASTALLWSFVELKPKRGRAAAGVTRGVEEQQNGLDGISWHLK